MLATSIDTLDIPFPWHPVVQQIQAATEPPNSSYPGSMNSGFYYMLGSSSTVSVRVVNLPEIKQLGWSAVEALETHLRFRNFADDWDAPGMEAYDDL